MKILSSIFRLSVFLFSAFMVSSCDFGSDDPDIFLAEEIIVDYGYGPQNRQKMDVFLPEGRSSTTPVVILIHGGFWVEGDKNDLLPVQQQLLNVDIASVNLNYNYVSPVNDYRGLMADVALALQKVKENAPDWGISNGQYHLVGFSAGGHMAMLYGYEYRQAGEVATVVSVAGPVGLTPDLLENPILSGPLRLPLEWLTGASLPANAQDPNYAFYLNASPITYGSKAVPTLLIHGTADQIVPFEQSLALKQALDLEGINNRLVPLEGASHDISESPLDMVKALLETTRWVRN